MNDEDMPASVLIPDDAPISHHRYEDGDSGVNEEDAPVSPLSFSGDSALGHGCRGS